MKVVLWIVVAVGVLGGCSRAAVEDPVATPTSSSTAPVVTTAAAVGTTTTTARGLVRIAVVGDTGTGGDPQYDVAGLIEKGEAEGEYAALVLLGDLIYENGDPGRLDEVIVDPYSEVLDGGTVLVPAIGNHDIILGRQDEILSRLGRSNRWYTQRTANTLVVVLDSNDPGNPDQLTWLEQTLADAEATWIIAAMHHPPYSAGAHGSSIDVRDAFGPLFEEYGVDLVLAGHDHDYQRSERISGVTYVVSGGGAKLRPSGSADFTATFASEYHFLDLAITDDTLRGTAIGLDGVIDEFTLP